MIMKCRYNVMNIHSLTAFARIKGGFNNGCRDVYFIRMLGDDGSVAENIRSIDGMLGAGMTEIKQYYSRVASLPYALTEDQKKYYLECYEHWTADRKQRMKIHITSENMRMEEALSEAIIETCEKYRESKKGMSESIEKNFILKLLWWTDLILDRYCGPWDERSCMKIIAENVEKEQEYLFYYMLTRIGADVLLLQLKGDIALPEPLKKLSGEHVLGGFVHKRLPGYEPQTKTDVPYVGGMQPERKRPSGKPGGMQPERKRPSGKPGGMPPERKRPSGKPGGMPSERERPSGKQGGMQIERLAGMPSQKPNREKTFEELALLASSIVMIAIHDKSGTMVGSGSGIMIGEGGYILTNYHVVKDGNFFSVRIEDDETIYPTDEVIKYNSVMDLAVIRIARKLTPLPIYKGREKLVRGQKVVAIGSPLGLFNSVSDGIISGFRTMDKTDMIQFTAPISHGSSGGAVLNMHGEVIGISTAGIESGQNINLAVPYDCITPFIRGFV